ncbi:dipeptide ABC transporter ATP-binding protein [Nonomuraea angiospora]|uniref:Peptide/nickel transport system ATP-binding protein n=1 Tax=Nonomuraea angiospora TaxID=46172 RepID=A0ABR9MH86_9ACTN|nr:ABC transporter ATP-binding protein [Nonomuraea angiospora]MBE1592280.1 peptide/nickel transport system ATP-binding protein [Nonomuraea angiospora]
MSLVKVDDLRVAFGATPVVHGVSFEIAAGECLALVGESGSGKSVTARTLVGLTGGGARVAAGELTFDGQDLTRLRERGWRRLRGGRIGFVLQDALVSLDPLRKVGKEIEEVLTTHTGLSGARRRARVVELLTAVGVPEPELRAGQLPYELSGGLRQRALIAAALAADPELVIADEPTTALDVTIQAQVLDLLAGIKAEGRSLLVISHDLAVVARLADRVAVMKDGVIVEQGPTGEVLTRPAHEYTRRLLRAIPAEHTKGTRLSSTAPAGPRPAPGEVVVRADSVGKSFGGRVAVQGVSFELRAGETLGIVGESGSGKTTTARIALGLTRPDTGTVEVHGRPWTGHDPGLRRDVQVVYQDTLASFDPRYTVAKVLAEALAVAGVPRERRRARSVELLELVGLGEEHLARRPLKLSGGQRQRVAIARALAPSPSVIVCDEPVSALDVSVQAQVLDLLEDVQRETGVAYLFISHDLGVVHHLCDRVLVMKDGSVVEEGPVGTVFRGPAHPYTKELVAAIPRLAVA